MNKRFALIACFSLIVGVSALLLFRWYAQSGTEATVTKEDIIKASKELGKAAALPPTAPAPLPMSRSVRLAIGSLGLPDETQNAQLTDLLAAELSRSEGLELVDRQSLEKVLREMQMNLSGLVQAKDAVRAGNLLRADWFILGTANGARDTNSIVVRIVDGRTGIFRNTAVVAREGSAQGVAQALALFVRRCRSEAAVAKVPVYVGIGAFEDLSMNNRLAEFPGRLRAYLMAAYKNTSFTMLEREQAETLLQEVRLDLAGLTENAVTNSAPMMQTAFWLIEGDYQSIDNATPEIELALRITRIFGRQTSATLRGPMGEPFFVGVKQVLDQTLSQKQEFVFPRRTTEARAQMARGKELAFFRKSPYVVPHQDLISGEPYQELTAQEAKLQRRKAEEAIRAFQAAVLLDPTNREAKLYLGACYCKAIFGRFEDARELFREVFEEAVQDSWHDIAGERLAGSFGGSSPTEQFEWFATAEKQTTRSNLQAFYHAQAENARIQILLNGADRSQGRAAAENQLLEAIRTHLEYNQSKPLQPFKTRILYSDLGMSDYAAWFGSEKLEAGRSLARLLPRMTSEFPALTPHLTATALSYQIETNNPVLPEFRTQLEWCRAHPKKVFALRLFWQQARYSPYHWCMKHGEQALAVEIMEGVQRAAQYTNSITFNDGDKIALAYAYKGAKQWREALAIFESFTNSPAIMPNGDGPWGKGLAPIFTAKEVAECKAHQGISANGDPREFTMGTNCFCMHFQSAFAADSAGLWVASGEQLVHLDFGLRTNRVELLPKNSWTGINCLLLESSKIWIGTDGDGLLEFDKDSRRISRYTEKEGLMNEVISSLSLAPNTLWIGYGEKSMLGGYSADRPGGGGLGKFDLRQREFHAFSPSLESGTEVFKNLRGTEPLNTATRRPVRSIAVGPDNDVWFSAWRSPLRRYRQSNGSWDAFADVPCSTLLADAQRLFVGGQWNLLQSQTSGPLGVRVLNFADGSWTELKEFAVLPSGRVSALTLDGGYLWVGGAGYVAKIDLARNELLNFSPIRAAEVNQIQIGGGFVWAQFDHHLHRAKLP
jgi:hypothetical protein